MTTPTPEDGCKAEELSAEQMEISRLRHEVEGLTNAGVVECMVRNPAVFERISDLERDLAARDAELAELMKWKAAVVNELIVAHIYSQVHDDSPRKAVHDAITWNCQVALDPAVSSDAQRLRDTCLQRAEAAEQELAAIKAENSKLRSALEIVHFKREPWQ